MPTTIGAGRHGLAIPADHRLQKLLSLGAVGGFGYLLPLVARASGTDIRHGLTVAASLASVVLLCGASAALSGEDVAARFTGEFVGKCEHLAALTGLLGRARLVHG
jgi:hypothetical protein